MNVWQSGRRNENREWGGCEPENPTLSNWTGSGYASESKSFRGQIFNGSSSKAGRRPLQITKCGANSSRRVLVNTTEGEWSQWGWLSNLSPQPRGSQARKGGVMPPASPPWMTLDTPQHMTTQWLISKALKTSLPSIFPHYTSGKKRLNLTTEGRIGTYFSKT